MKENIERQRSLLGEKCIFVCVGTLIYSSVSSYSRFKNTFLTVHLALAAFSLLLSLPLFLLGPLETNRVLIIAEMWQWTVLVRKTHTHNAFFVKLLHCCCLHAFCWNVTTCCRDTLTLVRRCGFLWELDCDSRIRVLLTPIQARQSRLYKIKTVVRLSWAVFGPLSSRKVSTWNHSNIQIWFW